LVVWGGATRGRRVGLFKVVFIIRGISKGQGRWFGIWARRTSPAALINRKQRSRAPSRVNETTPTRASPAATWSWTGRSFRGSTWTFRPPSSVQATVQGMASRGLSAAGVASTSWSAMAEVSFQLWSGAGSAVMTPSGSAPRGAGLQLVGMARVVETGRDVIQGREGRRGAPERDKRLTLDLLDAIASATEGGQHVNSSELELRGSAPSELLILGWAGARWPPEQVWRELRLLWDEGLIRAENTKTLADHGTSLLIFGLTAEGWERLGELRRSPVHSLLTKYWTVLVPMLVSAVVAVVIAVLWG
jgi:hypothetical protein